MHLQESSRQKETQRQLLLISEISFSMSSKFIVYRLCNCNAIQGAMIPILSQASLIVKALDIARNLEVAYETCL